MAAVLACGPEALLSHRSAAALWELLPSSSPRAHVTVAARGRARRPGIVLHQVRHLHPDDRAIVDDIPVTSVPRTLLDVAGVETPRRLERAYEEADRRRLLDTRAVAALCERSAGRRGLKSLRALLAERRDPPPDTRSLLERRFLEFCRDHDLPEPAFNVAVAGYEVDAAWPPTPLVVELDSYRFHRGRTVFEEDRARDAALQLADYRVLRVTDRRLKEEPGALAATIRRLLAKAA